MTGAAEGEEITRLLRAWSGGDRLAGDRLTPLVFDELHRISKRIFAGERSGHTLQPTALVNEAYANLISAEIDWQDRSHFLAVAARMMRRLLINHAEARGAAKRGGGLARVTLVESAATAPPLDVDLIDLGRALEELERIDPRKARIIDYHYFSGMTVPEMEAVTGLSPATIGRDLRFARAWLLAALDVPS